jgi:hypothetical protein
MATPVPPLDGATAPPRVRRAKPPYSAISLVELASRLTADAATVPRRVLVHAAHTCECWANPKTGADDAPPAAAVAAAAAAGAGTLWVRLAAPFGYEVADALRVRGLAWRDRVDPIYYSYALYTPPASALEGVEGAGDRQLAAECAFVGAWRDAMAAAAAATGGSSGSGSGDATEWELEAMKCARVTGPEVALGTAALVFNPASFAAHDALAAALRGRGARATGDDAVVAVGCVALDALAGDDIIPEALRASGDWRDACRDEALRLRPAPDAGEPAVPGAPPAPAPPRVTIGHHLAALQRLLRARGGLGAAPTSALASSGSTHAALILQHYADVGKLVIDCPGGGRRVGESSLQCALREADEEAGLGGLPTAGGCAGAAVEQLACIDCDAHAVAAAQAVAADGAPSVAAAATPAAAEHRVVYVLRVRRPSE